MTIVHNDLTSFFSSVTTEFCSLLFFICLSYFFLSVYEKTLIFFLNTITEEKLFPFKNKLKTIAFRNDTLC